jgi:hypothetical protein
MSGGLSFHHLIARYMHEQRVAQDFPSHRAEAKQGKAFGPSLVPGWLSLSKNARTLAGATVAPDAFGTVVIRR